MRDHESGKDGAIVGRISQFRKHRPEPVTNRSCSACFERERGGGGRTRARLWHGKSIVHLPDRPLCLSLSLGFMSPRRGCGAHRCFEPPSQIYRPTALKRHPVITYKCAIYKRNKLRSPSLSRWGCRFVPGMKRRRCNIGMNINGGICQHRLAVVNLSD